MSEETAQSSLTGTQADTGWRPDTPAAGTSNEPIVPLKPQRQRALGKPLLPVATDLYPSFLPPLFIRQVISPSIHCFHARTSFSPALSFSPPPARAMSLMLCQWASAEVSGYNASTSPTRNRSSKTCQAAIVAHVINSNNSTGWTYHRGPGP